MFLPEGRFRHIWDMAVVIVAVYSAVTIPLIIVFSIFGDLYSEISIWFTTIVFISDIAVKFNTAYPAKGKLVYDRKKIARRYLKSWFAVDLLAALPLSFIGAFFLSGKSGIVLKIFRLNRLFKLLRINKPLKRLGGSRINPAIFRLILLVFWVLMAAHIISCGWIIMTGNPQFLENIDLYITAFYWTTTTLTTIGYGDITPDGRNQLIFVIIVEFIGAGMYGLIIGNIANLIANIDVAKAQHREKMEKLNTFLKYRDIPQDLGRKINDYFDYLWQTRRGYDESSVLKELPSSLKTWVALFLNKEIIEKVPIFEGASKEFIKETIMNLVPVVFTPGDYIVTSGEVGHNMFFISKGTVDVVSADGNTVYASLSDGQFFGEIALLLSMPRTASIVAKGYCDLYSLDKDTFDRILARYPSFARTIQDLAKQRRDEINASQLKKSNGIKIEENDKIKLPEKITALTRELNGSNVNLKWKAVEGDVHYEVIRRIPGSNRWVFLGKNLQQTAFTDQTVDEQSLTEYRVRYVNASGPGPWSDTV